MKLSIIMPVYNMAKDGKLQYCLESLLKQQVDDYEIIAIDDKSTDNSLTVLYEYAEKHPDRIKVIASEENRRQGGAKNLGLNLAQGEWIGFMDSDDWAKEDMFAKLLKKAEETGADVVGCDYLRTEKTGLEEGVAIVNNTGEQCGILDETKYRKLIIKPGSMVIKIYKRSIFEENHIRFPEKMFYEDNALGAIPLLYAKRFERVEENLYFYYQHSESTVHKVTMDKCQNRIRAAEIYLEECKKRGFYEKYPLEIEYKVFELGYRNTLFSHLQSEKRPDYSFVVRMRRFLEDNVPNCEQNPYYEEFMDEENKKLIKLHRKNVRLFLWYYKLLNTYRRIRYGKA